MDKSKLIRLLKGESKFRQSDAFHEASKIKSYPKKKQEEYYPLSWIKINYKTYPRLKRIKLPAPLKLKANLGETLLLRRSKREFLNKSLTLREVSTLLSFSGGITYQEEQNWDQALRAYPSAGARYPLELYLAINKVELVEDGLYHYNVKEHSLEVLRKGNFKEFISKNTGQEWLENVGLVVLISAIFDRTRVKYGERGYRFIFLDAGHLAQNLYLVATALGFGCCAIGGFTDDEFNRLLDLQGQNESVIYLTAIGRIKQ